MEMKNPKLTYMKEGKTISSELDEKTLNDILQSVLLAKPELTEYDAIKYLFYGLTQTNSVTYFELSFIDDMGFKCTIEKANSRNDKQRNHYKIETEMNATKKEELAIVKRGDFAYNYINKDGKLILNEWFRYLSGFYNGFAVVKRANCEWNFIDKKGKILSNEWFKSVDYFNNDGFARVQRTNNEWNFIDKKGKILSEQWFMWVDDFHEGFARVQRRNDKWNFIDKKGNYLSDEWFMWAYYFHDGFARVKREDKLQNLINKQGKILSDEWFYSVEDFQ